MAYDKRPEPEQWLANHKSADANYLETFGLQLVAGRNLQPGDTTREFVVNEALTRKLNLASPDEILLKNIQIDGANGAVVGVVRDFHNWELSEPIAAIAFSTNAGNYQTCAVRVSRARQPNPGFGANPDHLGAAFPGKLLRAPFHGRAAGRVFGNRDDDFAARADSLRASPFLSAASVLYGLAAFMVTRKRKEVGIRKTLGAKHAGHSLAVRQGVRTADSHRVRVGRARRLVGHERLATRLRLSDFGRGGDFRCVAAGDFCRRRTDRWSAKCAGRAGQSGEFFAERVKNSRVLAFLQFQNSPNFAPPQAPSPAAARTP